MQSTATKKELELYIYRQTVEESFLKTVITKEYVPITKADIEWKWELSEGSWDGERYERLGWIPYVNGKKQSIYTHAISKHDGSVIASDMTSDDYSMRLYPNYWNMFGLKQGEPV